MPSPRSRPGFARRFWESYVAADCQLSDEDMNRLGEHKYSAVDTSWLDEMCMKKFWDSLVPFVPLWMAPNLITLAGLIVNLVTCLVLSFFSFSAKEPAPSWAYALAALGLFLYQTLDAIDGKQARRTNSSSPLGELFDHGCDAVSQVFVTLNVSYALALGHVPNGVLLVNIISIILFYAAHWTTYCTGQLRFSRFDVTEAQMTVILLLLTTAALGPGFWSTQIMFGLSIRFFAVAASLATSLYQMSKYCRVIFYEGAGKNGSTVADTSVLFPLIPVLLVIIPFCMIYSRSLTSVFTDYATLFVLCFGAVEKVFTFALALTLSLGSFVLSDGARNLWTRTYFVFEASISASKMSCRLVIAHMSRSELIIWDWIYLSPILLMLNQYYDYVFDELTLLMAATVYAWVSLLIFSVKICEQFCEHLNINCFTLVPRAPRAKSKSH